MRNNLEDARRHREDYFNRRTSDRAFRVGEQVLVKFPKIPIGVNPKFYKIWRGPYTVVKVLSRLNLKLQASAYGKTIVVHVDRVKHMNLHDEGVIFDANRNALSLDTPNPVPSGTFKANERDSTVDICVSFDPDLQDNVSVRYHSPDETFSSYPESDTESESDDSGDKGEDRGGDVSLPPSPAQPQQLFVEYDHPAEDNSYAGRLTRGQAAFRGINVEDFPLPAHCPTSKRAAPDHSFGRTK